MTKESQRRSSGVPFALALLQPAIYTFVVGAAVLLFSASAGAQTLSGTLDAQLTITSACRISGSGATSGLDFGDLNFGTAPSTFVGQLSAQATNGVGGPGNTQIICSPDITGITITINGGLHAGQGSSIGSGTRAMSVAGPSYIPYEIYSNVGHTTVYPIGAPGLSVSIGTPGSVFDLPVYGLVNKTSTSAIPLGSYQDTLTVTLTW